jgi:hypothetical protein
MNLAFVQKLQMIRDDVGIPLGIVEGGGYRCDVYDKTISAHKEGHAADLDVHYRHYYAVIKAAMKVGITGIGVKNKGSGKNKRFQIHLDDAEEVTGVRPRPWVWTY